MTARKTAAAKKAEVQAPTSTIRVWPSPDLGPLEYAPGIPADGIDLSPEEAGPMLESGIVTTTEPVRPAEQEG